MTPWVPHAGSAASGMPVGYSPARRYQRTPMRHYWRRTATALHAGAVSSIPPQTGFVPSTSAAEIPAVAVAGPQGAGERWAVDLVQVNATLTQQVPPTFSFALPPPPLVIQQVAAQATAAATAPPPPIVAQAWLQVAGVNFQLLAQTTQGASDAMSVACPHLSPGEAIAVVWYGWAGQVNGFPFMWLRGTRYAMSVV